MGRNERSLGGVPRLGFHDAAVATKIPSYRFGRAFGASSPTDCRLLGGSRRRFRSAAIG